MWFYQACSVFFCFPGLGTEWSKMHDNIWDKISIRFNMTSKITILLDILRDIDKFGPSWKWLMIWSYQTSLGKFLLTEWDVSATPIRRRTIRRRRFGDENLTDWTIRRWDDSATRLFGDRNIGRFGDRVLKFWDDSAMGRFGDRNIGRFGDRDVVKQGRGRGKGMLETWRPLFKMLKSIVLCVTRGPYRNPKCFL